MNIKSVFMMLVLLLCSRQASAVLLSFDSVSSIGVNDTVSINVNLSGLGDFYPDSLGAFYAEILFNPTVLSLTSVEYGVFLGNPEDPFETDIVTTSSSGIVSLEEFSFLFDYELDNIQPSTFTLATLTFTGISEGFSNLDFGDTDFSDAIGNTLYPDLSNSGVHVNAVSVSEPPSINLLCLLGLGLAFLNRKRKAS